MKGQTFRVLTAVVVLAAVALVGAIVWAQATKTTLSIVGVVTGGGWDEWREDGNIAHGRGTWYYDVYDESGTTKIGTGYGIMNVNFNMETLNGVQSGSMTFDLTEGGIGTFEGRFTEKMTNSYWEGEVVLHGTGDSAGLKAKGTWGRSFGTTPLGLLKWSSSTRTANREKDAACVLPQISRGFFTGRRVLSQAGPPPLYFPVPEF